MEPTLDITAWDGPGRRATWTVAGRTLELPALVVPHTSQRQLPTRARIVQAHTVPDAEDVLTLLHQGSTFHPNVAEGEMPEGVLTLPPAVPMPTAAGPAVQRLADLESPPGLVHVTSSALEAPDDATLVLAAGLHARRQDAWRLPDHLVKHREAAGVDRVLFTPGLGHPDLVPLLIYAGVDLIDGTPAVIDGLQGRVYTDVGVVDAAEVPEIEDPVAHNLAHVERLVAMMRRAIPLGRARLMVEAHCARSPEAAAMLRRLDREHAVFVETATPVAVEELPCPTEASLRRAEVQRWVHRLETRYTPPERDVVVLVPCSHRKPYSLSGTHRRLSSVLGRHEERVEVIVVTSPLGAVPMELELHPPAAHYDIAVTGEWNAEEQRLVQAALRACIPEGATVISHLSEEEHALIGVPEAIHTGGTNPMHGDNLDLLKETLEKVANDARRGNYLEDMEARISFQFGAEAAKALCEGARVRGRYPRIQLWDGETRLGMIVEESGLFVPTLDAAERLLPHTDLNLVEIEDFRPKGTVFAVGVKDAHPEIRIGDELILHHNGELRGVGRALMAGPHMVEAGRGGAVMVRHTAKASKKETKAAATAANEGGA